MVGNIDAEEVELARKEVAETGHLGETSPAHGKLCQVSFSDIPVLYMLTLEILRLFPLLKIIFFGFLASKNVIFT